MVRVSLWKLSHTDPAGIGLEGSAPTQLKLLAAADDDDKKDSNQCERNNKNIKKKVTMERITTDKQTKTKKAKKGAKRSDGDMKT